MIDFVIWFKSVPCPSTIIEWLIRLNLHIECKQMINRSYLIIKKFKIQIQEKRTERTNLYLRITKIFHFRQWFFFILYAFHMILYLQNLYNKITNIYKFLHPIFNMKYQWWKDLTKRFTNLFVQLFFLDLEEDERRMSLSSSLQTSRTYEVCELLEQQKFRFGGRSGGSGARHFFLLMCKGPCKIRKIHHIFIILTFKNILS